MINMERTQFSITMKYSGIVVDHYDQVVEGKDYTTTIELYRNVKNNTIYTSYITEKT